MIRSIPYWHVDAFAERAFEGNQAAVMILDGWLEDRILQAIAAENNFAETAFLVRTEGPGAERSGGGQGEWLLRWFAPQAEIRLCGHATLASGHVLLSHGLVAPDADEIRFATSRAGVLTVRRDGDGDGYALALPAIPTVPSEWPAAVAALGAVPDEIARSADGYNVFLYPDAGAVRALAPDMAALAGLGDHQFICTAPGDEKAGADVVSRVFAPAAGVPEDSVTGSAHAVLSPFWAQRLGRARFSAFQASQRGGRLTCRLDGEQVWLGGPCVTVVEGRFLLQP